MKHRTPEPRVYRRRLNVKSLRVMAPGWVPFPPSPPPPPPGTAMIEQVNGISSTVVEWTFNAAITSVPSVAALAPLQTSDGNLDYRGPSAVTQPGPNTLRLTYPDMEFGEGSTYRIQTAIPSLLFTGGGGGNTVAIPQSGDIGFE